MALEAHKDSEDMHQGVHVATWALSVCLLQPDVHFAEAIKMSLQRVGAKSDRVAQDLHKCMSCPRWFFQWQTIESLCKAALTLNGAPACSTTKAKKERKLCIAYNRAGPSQPALHRPDCPCVADAKRPSKRARLGGA